MRTVGERWELVREIASGGMGSVHEARHVVTQQRAAVKLLHAHLTRDPAHRERFLREVSAPARIGVSAGICPIYDAGFDDDGTPYIAMELLEGHTLRDLIAQRVPIARGLDLVERLLVTLAAAHAAGVVHRDLKPENVFVTHDDRVLLLDFGIARDAATASVTLTGTSMGTPQYMSPEQSMDVKRVGPATDVWAVGVMLYEIVAGDWPFEGDTPNAIVVAVCTTPPRALDPTRPGVTPALKTLIERCLSKDPDARPRDASELRAALSRAARAMPPTLPMVTATPLAQPVPRDRREPPSHGASFPYLVLGLALLGAALALGLWMIPSERPSTQPPVARAEQPVVAPVSPPPIEAHDAGAPTPVRPREALTAAQLSTVVARERRGLQRCWEQAIRGRTGVDTTRLEIDLTIGETGVVSRSEARGPLPSPVPESLRDCLETTTRRWRFPPSSGESRANFPIVFTST